MFIRGIDTTNKIHIIFVVDISAKILHEGQQLEKEMDSSNDESHALVSIRISFQYTNKLNYKPNDKQGQFSNLLEERKHNYRFNNNCNYCGKKWNYAKDCHRK